MKIAFVSGPLVGVSGGAERALSEVAGALVSRGHDVRVLTPDMPGRQPFHSYPASVRILNLGTSPTTAEKRRRRLARFVHRSRLPRLSRAAGAFAWEIERAPMARRLQEHFLSEPADVAIAFGPLPMAWLAEIDPGCSRLASIRNNPAHEFQMRKGDPFPYETQRFAAAIGRFDRIAVQLDDYLEWFSPVVRQRLRVLPNVVHPAPQPEQKTELLAVAIGRLAWQKRPDLLIDAWMQAAPRLPGWRLEIYGQGYLRSMLEARIAEAGMSDSLALMGARTDIEPAYARARVLVHAASYEGFPNVVAEALARAVPVIGYADCSGLNALVRDGVNGCLVQTSDDRAAELAEALVSLLSSPEKLDVLGGKGPETMAPYAPEAVIDIWENLLREMVRSGSNAVAGSVSQACGSD